jgi:hypothetical protein
MHPRHEPKQVRDAATDRLRQMDRVALLAAADHTSESSRSAPDPTVLSVAPPDHPLEAAARAAADRIVGDYGPPRGGSAIWTDPEARPGPEGSIPAADEKRRLGNQFGFDFSRVRIHADDQAAQ